MLLATLIVSSLSLLILLTAALKALAVVAKIRTALQQTAMQQVMAQQQAGVVPQPQEST